MAILIKADGTSRIVRAKDGRRFSLDELRDLVGGPVEVIADQGALGRLSLLVNADGWRLGERRNLEARALCGSHVFGDAVLMTRADFGHVTPGQARLGGLMETRRTEADDEDTRNGDGPAVGVA